MTIRTTLKETVDRGIGLFASDQIKKGDVVYEDDLTVDRLIPGKVVEKMKPVLKDFILFYASYEKDKDMYYLDADNTRFMNHSNTANTTYSEETGKMIATSDIAIGEEITSDYRKYDDYSKEGHFGFEVK